MPKENSENNKEKRICQICGKALVAIGTARKNGTIRHGDWKTRLFHKKCYKEI
jgi:hypothetical protein